MHRSRSSVPIVTATACIWCVLVFFIANSHNDRAIAMTGYVSDFGIVRGKIWGMVTSAFLHVQPIHLIFNLYWLWFLGGAFEKTFGPGRFLLFMLTSAFVGSGIQFLSGSTGIGMSGVGYALFGFGWITRTRYPEFARVVTPRTVQMFVIWGVACVILTQLNVMRIANLAHAGGLAFGVAVGGLIEWGNSRDSRDSRALAIAGLLVLTAASVFPVFWNPRSGDWVALQAERAHQRGNYSEAVVYYRKSISMDVDPEWAWSNLARIYAFQRREEDYANALKELRQLNPDKAAKILEQYGEPDLEPSGGANDSKTNPKKTGS